MFTESWFRFWAVSHHVVGFGHIGNGNLHLNVATKQLDKNVEKDFELWVFERVAALQGSISSEQGLGFLKRAYIGYSKTP
ncbi:D-2-hydroxyglutarate dehydrogenase [Schizosaccharomyces osmophilus]|uniref:D-2-hydroxyglutarate dehydrogenase n=1 Tax=Schizosaccharomyces osmophilus TaxID=2545709 RepID=A0AAE9WA38_9SCHI|nr:D-2-hydroxyglutarate dehydrogenase [Schizosaccharomyces osmophilus]WBW72390.1 D-2-hydroxyglutarate dehydrogenase [Schizosaccharomyces osmophilus]